MNFIYILDVWLHCELGYILDLSSAYLFIVIISEFLYGCIF